MGNNEIVSVCLLLSMVDVCDGHHSGYCASIASKITLIHFPSQEKSKYIGHSAIGLGCRLNRL